MALAQPLSVNYPSPLVMIPSDNQLEPVEGRALIPVEVLWGSMGGAGKSVSFNVQNNSAMNFSQISSLRVDNSASLAPVVFVFPDTLESITIAAGVKIALVSVFSNGKQFTVSAPTAVGTDITRFHLLNFPVLPFVMP